MRVRLALLAVVAVACALAASGCSAASHPVPTPTATQHAASTPTIPAGTVVATGTLTSWNHSVSGAVVVTRDAGGDWAVTFPGFSSSAGDQLDVFLSTEAIAGDARCDGSVLPTFDPGAAPSATAPAILHDDRTVFIHDDPTFLKDVVLGTESAATTACARPVEAVAPLTWTMPDMDPDLKVVDRGPTGGARGTVVTKDGAPWSYTVVTNDLLPDVARRFGLTPSEIFYLNPARTHNQNPILFIGEVLNLSRANR
jgi:hypothetical protein